MLGGSFESLKVYDSESGSLLNELPGGSGINVIAVDCLRDRIVSGHDDATIRVRDAEFQERATIHRVITPQSQPCRSVPTAKLCSVVIDRDAYAYGAKICKRTVHSINPTYRPLLFDKSFGHPAANASSPSSPMTLVKAKSFSGNESYSVSISIVMIGRKKRKKRVGIAQMLAAT